MRTDEKVQEVTGIQAADIEAALDPPRPRGLPRQPAGRRPGAPVRRDQAAAVASDPAPEEGLTDRREQSNGAVRHFDPLAGRGAGPRFRCGLRPSGRGHAHVVPRWGPTGKPGTWHWPPYASWERTRCCRPPVAHSARPGGAGRLPQGGRGVPAPRGRRAHRALEPLGDGPHPAPRRPLVRGTASRAGHRVAGRRDLAGPHPSTRRPGALALPGEDCAVSRLAAAGRRRRPRFRPCGAPPGLAAGRRRRTLADAAARRAGHRRPGHRPGLRGADGRTGPARRPPGAGRPPDADRSTRVSAPADPTAPTAPTASPAPCEPPPRTPSPGRTRGAPTSPWARTRWPPTARSTAAGNPRRARPGLRDRRPAHRTRRPAARPRPRTARLRLAGDPRGRAVPASPAPGAVRHLSVGGVLRLRLSRAAPPRLRTGGAVVARTRGWRLTEQDPTRRLGVLRAEERCGIHRFGQTPPELPQTWLGGLPEPWTFGRDAGYALTHVVPPRRLGTRRVRPAAGPRRLPPRLAAALARHLPGGRIVGPRRRTPRGGRHRGPHDRRGGPADDWRRPLAARGLSGEVPLNDRDLDELAAPAGTATATSCTTTTPPSWPSSRRAGRDPPGRTAAPAAGRPGGQGAPS